MIKHSKKLKNDENDRKTNKWAKNVLFLNLKNNNLELRSQSNSSMRFKTLN